jgi:hypothetical protein
MTALIEKMGSLNTVADRLIVENEMKEKSKLVLLQDVAEINKLIESEIKKQITTVEACNLLTKLADSRVKKALNFIVTIINDTLSKLFPDDFKKIEVEMDAYHETYPQMRLKLINSKGKVRSLKTQEGTGVSQIISIFYIICLIYITGYRRFVHLDEVLNGLHTDAWEMVDDILKLFEDKLGFQFIITQHNYIPKNGRMYYLAKDNHEVTYVSKIVDMVDGEEIIVEDNE